MHLGCFLKMKMSFCLGLWLKCYLYISMCLCVLKTLSSKNGLSSFSEAEELYQKRILTITGICIALLVVGIMCVVAYCKTK